MDLVESGVVMFVAFVFIGGSLAYFAGPPDDFEEFLPDAPAAEDPCKLASCGGPNPAEPIREEAEDDDEGPRDDGNRDKGKKRGKD